MPYLVLVIREVGRFRAAGASVADWAVLELATRSTLRGHQLLGPYSRYGWHQPGPALFWWYAPSYWLSGERLSGLVVSAAVFNGVGLITVVVVVGTRAGRAAAWAAAASCLWFTWSYGMSDLRDPWNPSMAAMPVALTIVWAAAVISGSGWALVALIGVASFAMQVHIGTVTVIGSVTAAALTIVALRYCRSPRSRLGPLAAAAAVGAVMWATVAYEQLTRTPGNVAKLLRFTRTEGGLHHPALQVAGDVAKLNALDGPAIGHTFHTFTAADTAFIGLLGILVISGAVGRRTPLFLRSLCALTLMAELASVAAGMLISGHLYLYLLTFVRGVAFVALVATGLVVLSRLRWRPLPGWVLRSMVCLVIVGALGLTAEAATLPPLGRGRSTTISALSRPVSVALRRDGIRTARVKISARHDWPAAAGLANQLERAGVQATVDRGWVFVFGEDRAPTGKEGARLLVADAGERVSEAAGRPLLAEAGGIDVYRLAAPRLISRPSKPAPAIRDHAP